MDLCCFVFSLKVNTSEVRIYDRGVMMEWFVYSPIGEERRVARQLIDGSSALLHGYDVSSAATMSLICETNVLILQAETMLFEWDMKLMKVTAGSEYHAVEQLLKATSDVTSTMTDRPSADDGSDEQNTVGSGDTEDAVSLYAILCVLKQLC